MHFLKRGGGVKNKKNKCFFKTDIFIDSQKMDKTLKRIEQLTILRGIIQYISPTYPCTVWEVGGGGVGCTQ